MSLKNLICICGSMLRNNPNNFYKTKNYINTLYGVDIEKFKHLLNQKKSKYENYSKIQIGETYINQKNNYILELFLLKWNKNSISKIHNHSHYGCTMKIIEGELIEDMYDNNLNFLYQNKYNKNDTGYINNNIGYHRVYNINEKPSYSLHLYCDLFDKPQTIKYFEA